MENILITVEGGHARIRITCHLGAGDLRYVTDDGYAGVHLGLLLSDLVASLEPAPSKHAARTAQDLLAERRATVMERSCSQDALERGLLQYQIESLDRDLATLAPAVSL